MIISIAMTVNDLDVIRSESRGEHEVYQGNKNIKEQKYIKLAQNSIKLAHETMDILAIFESL